MNTWELQSYFAKQIAEDRNETQGYSCLIKKEVMKKEKQQIMKEIEEMSNTYKRQIRYFKNKEREANEND